VKAGMGVAIIIPCYNYGRFLGEAIESALAQTVQPDEILVVDDGSTDDTAAVASYHGDRVRYVHQENEGPSSARNHGIRITESQWMLFLDADDVLDPRAIEELSECARLPERPDLVFGDASTVEGDTVTCERYVAEKDIYDCVAERLTESRLLLDPKKLWCRVVRKGNFIPPSTTLIHRCCFEHSGFFNERVRRGEDWELIVRLALQHRFVFTARVLCARRRHESNLTNPDAFRPAFSDSMDLFESLLSLPWSHRERHVLKEARLKRFFEYGKTCHWRGYPQEARRWLFRAWKGRPHYLAWLLHLLKACLPSALVRKTGNLRGRLRRPTRQ